MGNIDIRQVHLGFRVGGRIQEMRVEEGDAVNIGDIIALPDPGPYQDQPDRYLRQGMPVTIKLVEEPHYNGLSAAPRNWAARNRFKVWSSDLPKAGDFALIIFVSSVAIRLFD
jgi:Biotin-lipoyl like